MPTSTASRDFATWVARLLATSGGAGYSPIAPGTCGTAVAAVAAWWLASMPLVWFAALTTVTIPIGVWAASRADASWGTHDNGRIVIDEVVGFWLTSLAVNRSSSVAIIAAFVAFRFFDIAKPPPVRAIDRHVGGGLGVILDDVAAGGFALAVVVLGAYLGFWPWAPELLGL